MIPRLQKLFEKNQQISQELQNQEEKISQITDLIAHLSEGIRIKNNRNGFILQILGQIGITLFLLIGGILLDRSITKPLSLLTLATETLSLENPEQLKIKEKPEEEKLLHSQDEIGTLARSFDQMRRTIIQEFEHIEQQNKKLVHLDELKDEFLANISHELRTPPEWNHGSCRILN